MKLYKAVREGKEKEVHNWTLDISHDELIELLIKSDDLLSVFNDWIKVNRK